MPELLVLNPVKRRRARKSSKRKVARKATRRVARRNPVATVKHAMRRRTRRYGAKRAASNPIHSRRRTRRIRRNPIGMRGINMNSISKMLKEAAIEGAGALGVDYIMGQINPHLPTSLQNDNTQLGAYDALKAGVTVMLGRALSKMTKGASEKMARGALTVQAYQALSFLTAQYAPNVSAQMQGVGYATPNPVTRGTARISPIMRLSRGRMAAFSPASRSPLLSAITPGRAPALLSGMGSRSMNTAMREGVKYR